MFDFILGLGVGIVVGHFAWETVVKIYNWIKTKA